MFEIGFLGLGKMGTSLLNGIIKKNLYPIEKIAFYAPSDKTKEKGLSYGINLTKDERDLLINSKIIILAVEPQKYHEIFQKFNDIDCKNKTIISLAPGKTISYLKQYFKNADIVRAMPNTPSLINEGVTTLAFDNNQNEEVINIFSSIGIYMVVNEEDIDKMIPLQGSMPAYIFEFVKCFVDNAVNNGIDKNEATKTALHAIIGSCLLALNKNEDLDILIDSVCSKGGSTIAGMEKLKEFGFDRAIKECYEACLKRSQELKN